MQRLPDRPNISADVAANVRAMVVDGRLAAGVRINEVRLAESLGVSRTPLREALSRLAAEGALEARPRLGFFVRALKLAEFSQLYDIRPILDPEALRLAGIPSAKRIAQLDKLNRELGRLRDPEQIISLDDQWHLELLTDCPNRVLVDMIENIMLRTRPYELALMRERANVQQTGEDHARIIAALRAGDLKAACAALKRNMESGKAPILKWLKAREAAQQAGKRG